MDTLTVDRATSIDALFAFIGAERVTASREAGRIVLTPEAEEDRDDGWPAGYPDPADYDNETDYICAIPGLADKIIASMNAPDSEFTDVPEEWLNA